jgi:signal transduction histidine kinase/DNA-binding LacI/PurR family transcriptional regulator
MMKDQLDSDSSQKKTRPTIGLLTVEAVSTFETGVAQTARERGINLICFAGGALGDPHGFNAQRNKIFDLVNREALDGLIVWSSAMNYYTSLEGVRDFCHRYRPLPIVSMAMALEGIPSVLLDNYQAMRSGLDHLIQVHGYRRIAFISGPEGHQESEERYRAYLEALADYGLPFDPQLVAPGGFEVRRGAEAIRLLLDERQVDFEAIVTVDDQVALSAMSALEARGRHVPYDVAVVGFDDELELVRTVTPPLTTVPQLAHRQGERAAEVLLALLQGDPVPMQTTVSTRLTVRDSCGCLDPAVVQAAVGLVGVAEGEFPAQLAAQREKIVSEMMQGVEAPTLKTDARWAYSILNAFFDELIGRRPGSFLQTFDEVLRRVVLDGGDAGAQGEIALSSLRRQALPCLASSPETLLRAEDLWQQGRSFIGGLARRSQLYQRLQLEERGSLLDEIGQTLLATFDVKELMDVIANELPRLGIKGCYLSLYEGPAGSTDYARLILAYDERGRATLPTGGLRFRSEALAPTGLLPEHRPYTLVVELLYFKEELIGFVLFDVDLHQGIDTTYSILRRQISSALKGALLFQQLQTNALQLAGAYQALDESFRRERQFTADASHELRTPLAAMQAILSVVREKHRTAEAYEQALADLTEETDRLRGIVENLLHLARSDAAPAPVRESVDLTTLLHDVTDSLRALAEAKGLTLTCAAPDDLTVCGDSDGLIRLFLNLLDNAIKYSEQGEIIVQAELDLAGPLIRVKVTDTGLGIAAEHLPRIFNRFYRVDASRSSRGAGLGLTIALDIARAHGGTIEAVSTPGVGTTFTVLLPG